jgi:hypothetical protein
VSPEAFSVLSGELREAVATLNACQVAVREGMPAHELKVFRENALKDIRRGARALDCIVRKHGANPRRRGAKR